MPTKRKVRKWQDYTRRYRYARAKAQNQEAPASKRFKITHPLLAEESESAGNRSLLVLTYCRAESLRNYVIGDIQSELPSERSTDFDIVIASSHGTRLGITAKRTSHALIPGTMISGALSQALRNIDVGSVGHWFAWPEMHTSPEVVVSGQASDSLQLVLEAFEIQRPLPAGPTWMAEDASEIWGNVFRWRRAPIMEQAEPQEVAGEWVKSSVALLQRLNDPALSLEDRRLTILFAETAAFGEPQRPELLSLLHRYILDERFNRDEDAQTSVGSAIRKFALNMDEASFEAYAEFFGPSETETLSCELELELAKALMWRLVYEPFDAALAFPKLQERLFDLAEDYLSPRLVLQKNYASVVLNAVLAALLLGNGRCRDLVAQVHALKLDWFTALFERRLRKTCEALTSNKPTLVQRLASFLPD